MAYKITISRWSGLEEISKENWKDLISALVLCGFEVYGGDDNIKFNLGNDEVVEEIEGGDND